MKIGIVGLPNVGKSTLFNAITNAGAECANYPFCTIEPNVGVVPVPDERLDNLAKMYNPQKVTHAVIEFVDIAGLVKGASKGEGLGNKFLSHIRETDAICQVVRCFEDSNIIHVDGSINPVRDIETINLELVFADLETVETDTGVQIAINNDTLLTIAQSIDEAMASVEGTDGESAEEDIEGLEFVSDYILAAAEGFREADPELSEEDSVALVSELVDALLAGVEEEFSMGSDESSDISFAELLSSALEYAAFEGTLSIDSADGVSAVLLDLSATAEGEDAIGVQLGIASITDGEFAEFTSPESFASLRDVVKNVASLYYTSIASYEEPSEEISTELAE